MPPSKGEDDLFTVLRSEFPPHVIVGQHPIKPWGDHGKTLYLDYYLPAIRLAVEADGRQHAEFVTFFHRSVAGYERSQSNDNAKDRWCADNGITMIRFSHKEKITQESLRLKIKELSNGGKGKASRKRN